jgi:hypothetical protein
MIVPPPSTAGRPYAGAGAPCPITPSQHKGSASPYNRCAVVAAKVRNRLEVGLCLNFAKLGASTSGYRGAVRKRAWRGVLPVQRLNAWVKELTS